MKIAGAGTGIADLGRTHGHYTLPPQPAPKMMIHPPLPGKRTMEPRTIAMTDRAAVVSETRGTMPPPPLLPLHGLLGAFESGNLREAEGGE